MSGEKNQSYLKLLEMTYDEAVEHLLDKYGPATANYFSEKSYERFMNGEINSISKGKYSRTNEGLYCHHIKEDRALNLSKLPFIKHYKHPYHYHLKEKLVYCDLVEHMILHALIVEENVEQKMPYGIGGYENFLKPKVREWFIDKRVPISQWMLNCYNKAYIEPKQAKEIIKRTDDKVRKAPLYRML